MTDIGTGSYTIIAQTAAEMMGVTVDQVVVRLGDSRFPESSGSGGQWGAASSTAGVYAACVKLREMVARKVGFHPDDAQFAGGQVTVGARSVPLTFAARTVWSKSRWMRRPAKSACGACWPCARPDAS